MAQNIKYLDDTNFNDTTSNGITLVDFYADWCGPCRMIAPIIEDLSTEFHGVATIAKLDIDKAPASTTSLGVMSIPTLILFKNGKEVTRVVGVKTKAELATLIKSAL